MGHSLVSLKCDYNFRILTCCWCFSVKSSLANVTLLEWDNSGRYLLIGDGAGNAEIWTTLTHLLNEWTRVAHLSIPDEPIQAGIFFCSDKRVNFSTGYVLLALTSSVDLTDPC